jgi:hypothetical protein
MRRISASSTNSSVPIPTWYLTARVKARVKAREKAREKEKEKARCAVLFGQAARPSPVV